MCTNRVMVQIQTSRKSPFIAETFIHFSKAHVCDAKSSGNLGRHFAIRSEACRQRDSTLPLEINMEVVFFFWSLCGSINIKQS